MSSSAVASGAPAVPAFAMWATRLQFFVFGAMFAAWGVHVPSVKAHFGLGEQALSIAMLASVVGAIAALTQAGRVVGRFGPRGVAGGAGLLCAGVLAVLLLLPGYAALLIAMVLFGAANSLLDVSVNTEATELEKRGGRPVMSGIHAMFSLGGMFGALSGSALQGAGVAPARQLAWAALAFALLLMLGCAGMLRMERAVIDERRWQLPHGTLLVLGGLAAIGFVAEGAIYDWSVLYLRQDVGAVPSVAALAYAGFSAAMAAARFAGDAVRARVPDVALLRASAAIGAFGLALALLWRAPVPALVGFTLVGFGFANVVPVLFSAAARVEGVSPATGIAAVSSIGYLGVIAGPPVIGIVAQRVSLGWALWMVVAAAVLLGLSARRGLAATAPR